VASMTVTCEIAMVFVGTIFFWHPEIVTQRHSAERRRFRLMCVSVIPSARSNGGLDMDPAVFFLLSLSDISTSDIS